MNGVDLRYFNIFWHEHKMPVRGRIKVRLVRRFLADATSSCIMRERALRIQNWTRISENILCYPETIHRLFWKSKTKERNLATKKQIDHAWEKANPIRGLNPYVCKSRDTIPISWQSNSTRMVLFHGKNCASRGSGPSPQGNLGRTKLTIWYYFSKV